MVRFPPSADDIKTQAKFTAYTNTLIKGVVNEPARLPSYDTQIKTLLRDLGRTAGATLRSKVRESLLVSTKAKVTRFDKIRGKGRNVVLDVNGAQLATNSPISQGDWTRAVRKSRKTKGVRNADDLLVLARRIANRMIRDAAFRRDLRSVVGWLSNFTTNSPSVGAQAIVCAGRRLDTVRLNDNIIRGFNVGIRVATSHREDRVHTARSVEIENNRLELLALGPGLTAPFGLFVGNAETLRICGNDLSLSQAANATTFFAEGVRVFGFVGHYMVLSQNRIALARIGIRIHHCEAKNNELPGQYHWVLSENLFEGPDGMTGIKATPSGPVIDRDNRTFS